jgi:carboxyl-terminal processing protease
VNVVLHRACWIILPIALFNCSIASAQDRAEEPPVSERAFIASKIYSCIELYFAHQAGTANLDIDAAYKAYLGRALAAKGRREFDLATLEFIAVLRNKHTQFNDQWLNREHGQPLGFGVLPLEGKWAISWTRDHRLQPGDIVRAIDGVGIEAFVRDKQRYVAASSARGARNLVFDRAYLFPQRFTLELEDGRRLTLERGAPAKAPAQEARKPATEGRWLCEGSVGYIKIPEFNDPNFEKTALDFVRKYRGARCLIIDVRGNGGGSTPYELIRQLMDREWRDWITSTPSQVALYTAQGAPAAQLRIESRKSPARAGAFTGQLLLLIDRFSCSACEDFVMPFKDNGRALLIGETTEGSSGQPYFFNFGNGMSLLVGAARYTFPDGSPFESVGIGPTIAVELHIADLRAGVDPVLKKAQEISQQK